MSLVKRLAYVEIEASDLERWRVFGSEVFGCELAEDSTADCLKLRIDARPWRIMVSRGPERPESHRPGSGRPGRPAEVCARLDRPDTPSGWPAGTNAPPAASMRCACLTDPSGIDVEVSYGGLLQPQRPFCAGAMVAS
jgi:hypothetical protein